MGEKRALLAEQDAQIRKLMCAQAPSRAKGDLKKATVSHLRRLLNSPQRIMRYFQHPKLHDAA
ncbi:hypothetical protein GWK36_05960 [Caldichromatium japonicum]|uniref:Uncharacterized protein n=1 Tax=Caldichromatium japonicum TaxID=2699430 RepID=A0A6G7VCG7_9GAMM|nr:hypothetical protein [Caldichromatium japonicum]QIK37600.1 hypothetical protein GWK36_05960 [Caldichromatium japonicum]